ncbi:chemotaxis protein CheD [Halalkalibacillus sediminis]|nr:chemotaxis protein CheD [Halalkalibacillus sediminis]
MSNIAELIKVGIADLNLVKAPQTIITSGLGSCVGVVLYDERRQIAGLIHLMLPDSSLSRTKDFKPGKFADTGIDKMLNMLKDHGANNRGLKAKIAGGAQMFNITSSNEMMRIGPRNVEAVQQILTDYKIPIISSDVGGNKGRTIEFSPEDSRLKIRTVHEGVTYI